MIRDGQQVRKEKKMNRGLMAIVLNYVMAFVIVLLLWRSCGSDKGVVINQQAASELQQYRDRLGREVTERAVITAQKKDLENKVAVKDSTIMKLQKALKKKTEVQVIHTVNTVDTVWLTLHDSTGTYTGSYKDNWLTMGITGYKDSLRINYSVRNEFSYAMEWQGGWLRRKTLVGVVINENPHTMTRELISFKKEAPKQKGIKIGMFVVGFGAGFLMATEILK